MSDEIRTLAHRWFEEVWNQRSSETIKALLSPSCVGHHEGEETRGPADFESRRDEFLTLLPDLHMTVDDILANDDDAVVRWTVTGHHTGTAGPLVATGRVLSFSGMTWLKFRDGRIVEGWDSWNRAGMIQQFQTPI